MQKPELQHSSTYGAQLERCSLTQSKGGRVMLAAGSSAVLDLDLTTGDLHTLFLQPSTKAVSCVSYSIAACCTAVGEQGFKPSIYVHFDGQGPQQTPLTLKGHNFGIAALAWSPQGSLLASIGIEKDRQLQIWSPTSGAIIGRSRLNEDYQCLEFLDDRTLCGINGEYLAVWTLEKTVSINRNTQYKLSSKRYRLELPTGCSSGKYPSRVVHLSVVHPNAILAGKRLWAGMDAGYVLQLKSNGKCEKHLDMKGGRMMQMATSSQYIACAMAGGDVQVFSAVTLERVAIVTCADTAANLAAINCAFTSDGSRLVALFSNGRLCTWDCSIMEEVDEVFCTTFHSSPIVDATVYKQGGSLFIASCSQDGKVQLSPLENGQLAYAITTDLRQHQELRGVRLSVFAASPDGLMLVTGDSIGSIHLLEVCDLSPKYFKSISVHETEITSAAFAPCMDQGASSCQYLAVGARSGALKVLDCRHNFEIVLQLQEAQGSPVVSVSWVQHGSYLQLVTVRRDGRVEAYALQSSAAGGACFARLEAYHPAMLKAPIVGVGTPVFGQVATAGSKGGFLSLFDGLSGNSLWSVTSDKNAGDVTSFALDEGICIAVVATSKNLLQVYDRESGKLLASSKVHLAGTSITKVLVTPCASCIVTAGEDASIRVWEIPDSIKSACLAEQQRLGAAVQLTSEAKGGMSTVTASSSMHPQNLFDQHFKDNSSQLCTSGNTASLRSNAVNASAWQQQHAVVDHAVDRCSDGANEDSAAEKLAEQFGQLQEQLQGLKCSPRHRIGAQALSSRPDTKLCTGLERLPAAVPSPAPACTTSLARYLPSDGLMRPVSPVAAAVQRSASGSSRKVLPNFRASLKRQPWRSPREGGGMWVPLEDADSVAAAELERCKVLLHVSDTADAFAEESELEVLDSREQATEEIQNTVAQPDRADVAADESPGMGAEPKAFHQDVTAGVDRFKSAGPAAAAMGQRRKRACWSFGNRKSEIDGCVMKAAAASTRRPLSALESPVKGESLTECVPRCKTALGNESSPCESEEFVIWPDPSTPAVTFGSAIDQDALGGEENQEMEACSQSSGSTSRRLTFSFGMAPPFQQTPKLEEEGGTPSFLGKLKQPHANSSTPPSVAMPLYTVEGCTPDANPDRDATFAKANIASSVNISCESSAVEQPMPASKHVLAEAGQDVKGAAAECTIKATTADRAPPQGDSKVTASAKAGGLRGRPPVPRLSLPRSQPCSPRVLLLDDDEISLREQYSARSLQASPLQAGHRPQIKSRLSSAGEGTVSGITGYATPADSTAFDGVLTETSDSEQFGEDLFSSPNSSFNEPEQPVQPACTGHSLFSPPKMQDNQLFEGAASPQPKEEVQEHDVRAQGTPGSSSESDSKDHSKQGQDTSVKEPNSADEKPAQGAHLTNSHSTKSRQHTRKVGCHRTSNSAGSGSTFSTDASAWSKPPAYDPLEPASGIKQEEGLKAAGAKRRRQMTPTVDHQQDNQLFGTSFQSQSTNPFTTHDVGSFEVAMAKNPAFSPSLCASPAVSMGAANMRRMSTCINVPESSEDNSFLDPHSATSPRSAAAQAASGVSIDKVAASDCNSPFTQAVQGNPSTAPKTAASENRVSKGRLSPAGVMGEFERAMQSLRQLQEAGLASESFMGRLGELGISIKFANNSANMDFSHSTNSCIQSSFERSRPCEEPSLAALKTELLQELRKEIASGALKI